MRAVLYIIASLLENTASAVRDLAGKPEELPREVWMSRDTVERIHWLRTLRWTAAND